MPILLNKNLSLDYNTLFPLDLIFLYNPDQLNTFGCRLQRNRFLLPSAFFFLVNAPSTPVLETADISFCDLFNSALVVRSGAESRLSVSVTKNVDYEFYDSAYSPSEGLYHWFYSKNNTFLQSCFTLWPFSLYQAQFIKIENTSIFFTYKSAGFSCRLLLLFLRKPRIWKQYYGLCLYMFSLGAGSLFFFQYVLFQIVGIGYYCEYISSSSLRIIVSNTTDLLLLAPETLQVGVVPPSGDNTVSTVFWCGGRNYRFLRNYAQYVRQLIKFNVYEYKGLLFFAEVKKKKVTKRKTK